MQLPEDRNARQDLAGIAKMAASLLEAKNSSLWPIAEDIKEIRQLLLKAASRFEEIQEGERRYAVRNPLGVANYEA